MKKFYILNPCNDINSLCASFLEEENFHSAITVVDGDNKKTVQGWEVTLEELRKVYRAARDKNIPLTHFRVGTPRQRSSEVMRYAQKKEFIANYQSRRNRPERLKQILGERGIKTRM